MPLLIGGATTSRAHTALKIDTQYKSPTVWVKDASRAVGVAQSLVSGELRAAFVAANDADYAEIRERHRNRGDAKRLVSLDKARAQAFDGGWDDYTPPAPRTPGVTVFDDIDARASWSPYIDWTPFFNTWELAGKYPAILDDADRRRAGARVVRRCAGDAEADRRREVVAGEGGGRVVAGAVGRRRRAPGERHDAALPAPAGRTSRRTARTSASRISSRRTSSGKQDWIGGFAVTAGLGIEPHVARFEADHDDYSAILLKALADRLAEALAERMHARVRRETWGYVPDETLRQRGADRREVRRHPPCPGLSGVSGAQREGDIVPRCSMRRRNAGVKLTESFAMYPAAAVSGLLLQPSAQPVFRRRPRVARAGRRLRASARVCRCSRRSGGWRRTWITTRSDLVIPAKAGIGTPLGQSATSRPMCPVRSVGQSRGQDK